MKTERFNLALGRVLIAAAHADSKLDENERRALEDILFRLPHWNAAQWRKLSADLQHPDGLADFDALCSELRDQLRDPGDAEIARRSLEALRRRLPAGSAEVEALETVLVEALGDDTDAGSAGVLSKLRKVIAQPLKRHAGLLLGVQREHRRLESGFGERVRQNWPPGRPAPEGDELHHLCVGAAILAHIVHLDGVVDDGEVSAMTSALVEHWGIDPAAAEIVTSIALDETARGIDLYANLRDFFEDSDEDERLRFLAAVFHVAAGDGRASMDEIEEVRRIGHGLLLSHQHFIAAKLEIPRDQRES